MARSRRLFFNFFKNVKRSKPHFCSYKAVLIAKARVGRGEAGNFGKVGGGGGVGPRTCNFEFSGHEKESVCSKSCLFTAFISHNISKTANEEGEGATQGLSPMKFAPKLALIVIVSRAI